MKLSDKVASLDLSHKLHEASITKGMDTVFVWSVSKLNGSSGVYKLGKETLEDKRHNEHDFYPAPLSVELLTIFDDNNRFITLENRTDFRQKKNFTAYDNVSDKIVTESTPTNALAELALYLHKKGFL